MPKTAKQAKASKPASKPIKSRNPPEPPKKALTAFFLYRQDVYDSVRRDNPEAKVTEMSRIISDMWNGLDRKEKDVY